MIHHWPQRLGKVNFLSSSTMLSFVGIMLCLLGCFAPRASATDAATSKVQYKLLHHVSYVHPADQIRDGQLYLPDCPGAHPAVLLIHGGEWTRGSNHDTGVSFLAPRLAARGWVVAEVPVSPRGTAISTVRVSAQSLGVLGGLLGVALMSRLGLYA